MTTSIATLSLVRRVRGRGASPASRRPHRRIVRRAKVTPVGFRFLLLALAVGLAAVNTGNNILYLMFAMMLGLIVAAGLFSERTLARLAVSRSLPSRLFADEPVPYRIVLTNGKRLMPAFSLRIREHAGAVRLHAPELRCPRLAPGATVTLDATATFRDRGAHELVGIEVATTYPFGLFEKTVRLPADGRALVYPAVGSARRWSGRSPSLDEGPRGTRRGSSGVSHLRDYQAGDDPRFIHWKHSARRAKLVVREPEREGARTLILIFSNRLPPDPLPVHRDWFEEAVRLTASLADRAIRDGWDVLLATWDGIGRMGRGALHLERILRTLALIGPSPPRPGDRLLAWAADVPHAATHLILVWDDPAWSALRPRHERVWIAAQRAPEDRS